MVDSLTRQPLGKLIASRKSTTPNKQGLKPVPEYDFSPHGSEMASHYSASPSKSTRSIHEDVENVPPDDASDPGHLAMTDSASDLRSRMEAELIALRRAQSIFADSHPSVDVHAKLQDLQEIYIGDLLVKDCQITQLKAQIQHLMTDKSSNLSTPTVSSSVPPPHASMLAARVQSLQKSLSQERHRRMDTEHRLEELLKSQETSVQGVSRLATSHRLEVQQLKSKLAQLVESNKRLQQQLTEKPTRPSGEQSPTATSPASSAVGGTEKVAYVKYAQLRAEKRQIEARLTAQIEEVRTELTKTISERDAELDKLREHSRRVVSDLERKTKLAQQAKTEDSKELRELKPLYEKASSEKSQLEALNFEYKRRVDELESDLKSRESELNELVESEKFLALELEDREQLIASLQDRDSRTGPLVRELEKLKEERMDLLEKIEEREDMLKGLQDDAKESRRKISDLESALSKKEAEIKTMVAQADELDNLLSRADQDVTSSRVKIQALTAELDALRSSELGKRDSSIQSLEHRVNSLLDERNRLTERIEQLMARTPSPKKDLVEAEAKIEQLEHELDSMRRTLEVGRAADDSIVADLAVRKVSDDSLTENVALAEKLFHEAVDKCTDAEFEAAVDLLEQAARTLASLSKREIDMNDNDTLRILESDIYGQLGVAFQSLSQVPEAIQAYTTAVDVDPEAHACHANLAVLLQHQSRLQEAEDHARMAHQLAPDIEEYVALLEQLSLSLPGLRHSTRW